MYSLAEIESKYNVTQRTLLSYIKSGRLEAVKIGGKWMVHDLSRLARTKHLGGDGMKLKFIDDEHKRFFEEHFTQDIYRKAFFYTLGVNPDTRKHIDDLYDFEEGCPKLDGLSKNWQTSGSAAATRMALNLYNGMSPSDIEGEKAEDWLPDSLFLYDSAPYFMEAVKLRYPKNFF